jgi:hypothetical protein
MSKKFRLLMVLVLVTGLLGGLLSGSTVSADPNPGTVIEIPRIDVGDVFGTGDWTTRIQIQNIDVVATTVTVEFYGGDPFLCPPNEDGPFYWAEMPVPASGVWTLQSAIPAGAESAFVYTDPAAYVAVTVDRWGPDAYGEFQISSSYTGIADPAMTGPTNEYFAPYIMHGYQDLDTTITIQNSGDACTSIWIYYKEEGNCEFMKAQHVEQIAPGEAIRIGPGPDADMAYPSPELDAPWLGSAYITANEPLAIIVDQLSHDPSANKGTLLTMRAMPYYKHFEFTWYADLLYREISGWTSSIQVQNLTVDSQPTFVTVDFFDQSGDEILFVGDWVCRNGAKTFYLPAITDLGVNYPFGYFGAAEIQSHPQVDYPGGMHYGEPIFAVVDIKKTKLYDASLPGWRHTVAGETQGGAYNAHPEVQKENAWVWAMPFIAKEQQGVTSRIAIRNNANCNKIMGNIYIYDETARLVTIIPVPWLHPKHMKVFDLAYFGQIARGFVGAAKFVVTDVEQLCDTDANGHVDNVPIMPSVVVLNYGFATELPFGEDPGAPVPPTDLGDLTRVYEGIPYGYDVLECVGDIFGDVYAFDFAMWDEDPEANEPIPDAYVVADTGQEDWTSGSGGYELYRVPEGDRTVTASKCGFFDQSEEVALECGADTKQDLLLVCQGIKWGYVYDSATGAVVANADVALTVDCEDLGREYEMATTTDEDGLYYMLVPLCGESGQKDAAWTLTVSHHGYDLYVETGDQFAADHGWWPDDCVGQDSEGCTEPFCYTDGDLDPCLSLIDARQNGDISLKSYAHVKGRVYCDGLVSDDGFFEWGEEQPDVLVKLYDDGSVNFYDHQYTDEKGYYDFTVSEDLILDGTYFDWGDNLDVVVGTIVANADDVDPDEVVVVNVDICPGD